MGRNWDMEERTESLDIAVLFERLKLFCATNIRLITRALMAIIVALTATHSVYPPALDNIGHALHFSRPSLASMLTLILSLWIFERLVVLQEEVRRPSVTVYQRSMENDRLQRLMARRTAKRIDLLQVSGQTVIQLLTYFAKNHRAAHFRLLLLDDAIARLLDADNKVDHVSRIKGTIDFVHLLEEENPGFKVEIRRYHTWPAFCAVIVDNDLVSLSYSPTFRDPNVPTVVRVRGHLATTVTAVGRSAEPLIRYAEGHFDVLWDCEFAPEAA